MNCGHCSCKKCILKLNQPFQCSICNEENNMNLNQLKECFPLMDAIEVYLNDLFSILYKQFASLIPSLKGKFPISFWLLIIYLKISLDDLKILTDRIDLQFEFIKDEIDIRIESLKMQLDKLNEDLKTELDDEKLFMKRFTLICKFLKY
jgi:hypothetical protein